MRLVPMLAALALTSAALLASEATARGYSGNPASNCVRVNGAQIFLNTGAVENDSTTEALDIDCPRINTMRSSGVITGQVEYRDVNGGDSVRCSLRSAFTQGPTVFTRSTSQSSTAGGINTDWSILVFGNLVSPQLIDYFLSCRIPPKSVNGRSGIAQYETFEQ
jgi:hypothetical protein